MAGHSTGMGGAGRKPGSFTVKLDSHCARLSVLIPIQSIAGFILSRIIILITSGGGNGRSKLDNQSLCGYSKDGPRVSPVRRCGFVAAVPEMAELSGFCFQIAKQFNTMQ